MLKYLYIREVFSEIPGEITLGISISGCSIHCIGCHSRELWEDKGMVLDKQVIDFLLHKHQGITTLLLLGGEHDMDTLIELFQYAHKRIKTAWYCGLDMVPKDKLGIYQYLDWIKLGHFDIELGSLSSPTTNQRLYMIEHQGDSNWWQTDMTHLFWKKYETPET